MCGIIGYVGNRSASRIVLEGLKNLEYRGYDSWGIAFQGRELKEKDMVKKINVRKDIGRISCVDMNDFENHKSTCSIGHTRWATHGGVEKRNAHPHLSQENSIAVVHNGIIENYQDLKEELAALGYQFRSGTDSEVLPLLIGHYTKQGNSFEEAVICSLDKIEGNYAIVAINSEDNVMIGARRGSPLVIGIGNNEYFIASDTLAFIKHTNKVIYLKENEMVIINGEVNEKISLSENLSEKNPHHQES